MEFRVLGLPLKRFLRFCSNQPTRPNPDMSALLVGVQINNLANIWFGNGTQVDFPFTLLRIQYNIVQKKIT